MSNYDKMTEQEKRHKMQVSFQMDIERAKARQAGKPNPHPYPYPAYPKEDDQSPCGEVGPAVVLTVAALVVLALSRGIYWL